METRERSRVRVDLDVTLEGWSGLRAAQQAIACAFMLERLGKKHALLEVRATPQSLTVGIDIDRDEPSIRVLEEATRDLRVELCAKLAGAGGRFDFDEMLGVVWNEKFLFALRGIAEMVGAPVGASLTEDVPELVRKEVERRKDLSAQIDKLATFIMENVPGEPSRSEGAVDTAIRVIGLIGKEKEFEKRTFTIRQQFRDPEVSPAAPFEIARRRRDRYLRGEPWRAIVPIDKGQRLAVQMLHLIREQAAGIEKFTGRRPTRAEVHFSMLRRLVAKFAYAETAVEVEIVAEGGSVGIVIDGILVVAWDDGVFCSADHLMVQFFATPS